MLDIKDKFLSEKELVTEMLDKSKFLGEKSINNNASEIIQLNNLRGIIVDRFFT